MGITYKKQLVSIDLKPAAALQLVLLITFCAVGAIVNSVIGKGWSLAWWWGILLLIAGYLVLLVLHEGVHAIGFLVAGAKPKDIHFGLIPKQMMAYCGCNAPLKIGGYRFALVLPFLLVGLIPWAVSVVYGNVYLVVLFSLLVAGAAGDLLMLGLLARYGRKQLILDHPEAPAFYLLYPADALPEGFVEATPEQELELRNRFYGKKSK